MKAKLFRWMVAATLALGTGMACGQEVVRHHLSLWATEPIGATDGQHCVQSTQSPREEVLPAMPATLTDEDIASWSARSGQWGLAQQQGNARPFIDQLRDHCFVLAIDGKVLVRGLALASETARLTRWPTLHIYRNGGAPYLRLTAGTGADAAVLIHGQALDDVLIQRAHLQMRLERLGWHPDDDKLLPFADEWQRAVQGLMDEHRIRTGMALDEVVALLGYPTVYPHGYNGYYIWRIDRAETTKVALQVKVQAFEVMEYQLFVDGHPVAGAGSEGWLAR